MTPLYQTKQGNLPSLRNLAFIAFFTLLILFAFSRAYNMLYGPRIVIEGPADGALLTDNLVTVSGTIKNASLIHLNGRKIFTDEKGIFAEDVVLQDGYNVIFLSARDRFGRDKEVTLHLIHKETRPATFSLLPKQTVE